MNAYIFTLQAATSIHPGGGTEIGLVDQPVQRERHTGFLKVEASSVKGGFRFDYAKKHEGKDEQVARIFGATPKSTNQDELSEAEAIIPSNIFFSDARILFFPVRSLQNVYQMVTCPMVLKQFLRDYKLAHGESLVEQDLPALEEMHFVPHTDNKSIDERVVLEEFALDRSDEASQFIDCVEAIFEKLGRELNEIKQRLIIIDDVTFTDFMKFSTEVVPRIRVGEQGVVEDGALWYEENVPPETIFYTVVHTEAKEANDYAQQYVDSPQSIRLGGNQTVGRGVFRVFAKEVTR
ncbi:type III-B CRISPR module RAMP protein Cmr4 [Bacillaceae bacterium SIJ1]|uniref:type III-B CRISPR module RAMP protein Cmr4 n=1 Tax=Litoribacterium kuwaitense TaxID=1398745 RepID=UPI0013EE0959|nr:type III-B CRISPR module RAMP protein Cmr4 [Litoribacterium kuwaitense]NGP44607.1 type III-B CRISPR module RAMP protein Cmr4 [Litoribacterium kuwaitense]